MKRVFELVRKFNIKAGCIINKYDLNRDISAKIIEFMLDNEIDMLASIPYDENFTAAMTNIKTIVEYDNNGISEIIRNTWYKINTLIENGRI
jgi:MinD superfamily P-loop ATPase